MLELFLVVLEQPLWHDSTFTVAFEIPDLAISIKLLLTQQFTRQVLELGGLHVVREDPTLVVLAEGFWVVLTHLAKPSLKVIQSS